VLQKGVSTLNISQKIFEQISERLPTVWGFSWQRRADEGADGANAGAEPTTHPLPGTAVRSNLPRGRATIKVPMRLLVSPNSTTAPIPRRLSVWRSWPNSLSGIALQNPAGRQISGAINPELIKIRESQACTIDHMYSFIIIKI
jgi:hypothetical protein